MSILKTVGKWLLRLSITGTALYITFRKVNWQQTKEAWIHTQLLWLIPAFIAYNLSQVFSAWRLYFFYKACGIQLRFVQQLKLYYIGMFYNLFLPGGIGGDGYKMHYLYRYSKKPLRSIFTATLLDRIHGLWALIILLASLTVFYLSLIPHHWLGYLGWTGIALIAGLGIYLMLIQQVLFTYKSIIWQTLFIALLVQGCQLIAAWCLLNGLHVPGTKGLYLIVFLCSSIAAVIPFTIGGAGARELVFVLAAKWFSIQTHDAVAMSLLFFLLTACSAFLGSIWHMPAPNILSSRNSSCSHHGTS
ncbi:MAG: flippase-like domain-containing protein [Thermoflavifilum sp.]|nr:flippase-like domain-containing protein [Thermoflavifilum sp.]